MTASRYATLQEMQDYLQLGTTGTYRTINSVEFELLDGFDYDGEPIFGWIALAKDENGETVDWDRVPQDEAVELKLIKKP
jgi:hypothetical protein